MKKVWNQCVAMACLAISTSVMADPLLIGKDAACYHKGFAPEEAQVALHEASRGLYLKTPCGWQFFRVMRVEEMAVLRELARPIDVPAEVLVATLIQLHEFRMAHDKGSQHAMNLLGS